MATYALSAVSGLGGVLLSNKTLTTREVVGTIIVYGGLGTGMGMLGYEYLGGKAAPWRVMGCGLSVYKMSKQRQAILYVGIYRTTPVNVRITKRDIERGYTLVRCCECEGTGWWAYLEPLKPGEPCVVCKGTGKRYINC
jgi:hypothetical protein